MHGLSCSFVLSQFTKSPSLLIVSHNIVVLLCSFFFHLPTSTSSIAKFSYLKNLSRKNISGRAFLSIQKTKSFPGRCKCLFVFLYSLLCDFIWSIKPTFEVVSEYSEIYKHQGFFFSFSEVVVILRKFLSVRSGQL